MYGGGARIWKQTIIEKEPWGNEKSKRISSEYFTIRSNALNFFILRNFIELKVD